VLLVLAVAVVDVEVLLLEVVVLEIMLGMERLVLSIPVAVGVAVVAQLALELLLEATVVPVS
jgi:hypothetical protein